MPTHPYFSGEIAVEASQLELFLIPHFATRSATPGEMPYTSFGRPAAFAAAKAPSTPSSSIDATMILFLPGSVVSASVTIVLALSAVASNPYFFRFVIGPGQTDWKPLR